MPHWRKFIAMLRSLLAIALAAGAVVLVNEIGGRLAESLGLPSGGDSRLAWDLGWVIASGASAVWAAAHMAPCAPRGHALATFGLLLAVAVWAVREMGADFPRWFCAGILLTLPLQAWLGLKLALRGRNAGDKRAPSNTKQSAAR